MNTRKMSVAGSFYPVESNALLDMIHQYNLILDNQPKIAEQLKTLKGKAVIVPHAGWIYSGFTANIAFRTLSNRMPKTVVVIGPSHRVGFDGISIADQNSYETPFGNIPIDTSLVIELKKKFSLAYLPQAHHEHSTEVQMPFIKHYMPNVKVIELVYSYAEPSLLEPIIVYLLQQSDIAVVISTDLSHYYSLEKANKLDAICLDAIQNENTDRLHQGCEACGIIGIEAMLGAARRERLKSILLEYRTSADTSRDSSRVVGYASALFSE